MERDALEQAWLELTRNRMPTAAGERGWPVRFDHCFQRICLDSAAGKVWYDVIAARPAYRHASDELLAEAVRLGEAALDGRADLNALNEKSLALRRARKRAQADG